MLFHGLIMLCDLCHKNIATVHLTEIVNNKVAELHICRKCAKLKTDELKQQLNISEFLSSIIGMDEVHQEPATIKCSFCGMTFEDFRKKGNLGCAHCYISFKRRLIPLIKKVHGAIYHKGKIPKAVRKDSIIEGKLTILKQRLKRAVELEEYEEAADLRDKIRKLEKKNQS